MQAIQKSNSAVSSVNQPTPHQKPRMNLIHLLKHKEMVFAISSGALMLLAWGIGTWSHVLSIIVYIAAYAVGGYIKAREGIETLVKERDLDVNLLMIAAALGAASIGYWNEGAMLIFIFALSGALESFASERSMKDISALIALRPETALKVDGDGISMVAVGELIVGDLLLVKPGEVIPADGVVQSGGSSVNQSTITGESIPVDKSTGDEVYAGTLNGQGALYVEVTSPAEGTLFSKIIAMVEQAQNETPASQRFIKKLEGIYAKSVVAITILLILFTPLVLGLTWSQAFYKAMVFLVVASPCAVVASVMPATLSAMSKSARKGVLFKGAAHMDLLSEAKVVAFDKTGTLTSGSPEVTDLVVMEGYDRLTVLAACAAAESLSQHPLARAIVRKAMDEGITLRAADELQDLPGWGIEALVEGRKWRIGKAEADADGLPTELRNRMQALTETGNTVSMVQCDGEYVALIALRDNIRPQAKETIRKLRELGIATAMLTGDRSATAQAIANEAGVDYVFGDLLPQDKVSHVSELRKKYGHVVMVGDGVNDAPALAAATVGIAMGGGGSGAALEIADVVLMNDNLERIADTFSLARRTKRIVRQNLVFAACVILTLVVSNFVQGIALPLGVVGHEGSTILVILNGLRLLR
ncbi:heavy metal translocating P-type ATPase [Paenibacillus lutimineralis]|uniref:Heavy metal translocating P-type ATPase n=1 Tax=Paenibacillus lutimineralis TaxID=2707005 RepID=A0A3S9V3Z5_9BACL|nr:heavy metal translocating P-type ATPase [Paenibacillus lutimineralis]AZS17270.1 heavy metal translocating P-type ATPase [Paenibacillus lutimineralis]